MARRGGKREGAGRKRVQPEVPEVSKDVATRVLARVGQGGWTGYADISKVTNEDDLAMHFLAQADTRYAMFIHLRNRAYGRAPIAVQHTGAGEGSPVEVHHTHELSDNASERLTELLGLGLCRDKKPAKAGRAN